MGDGRWAMGDGLGDVRCEMLDWRLVITVEWRYRKAHIPLSLLGRAYQQSTHTLDHRSTVHGRWSMGDGRWGMGDRLRGIINGAW